MNNSCWESIKIIFDFLFTDKYEHDVNKQSVENFYFMVLGVILGVFSSVVIGITITSMYRLIDNNPKGHNLITFLVGILGTMFVVWLYYKLLKKLTVIISAKPDKKA